MSYIDRRIIEDTLLDMTKFHADQIRLYKQYNLDFLENSGRRNIVMSHAQERFLAHHLANRYKDVTADGRTGEADIVIGELGRELECKITSPRSGGRVVLQTDYFTLKRKKCLDYIYIVACSNFEQFCVLHYEGLTIDDFNLPGKGARGKAAMNKDASRDKCNVLFGNIESHNENQIKKANDDIIKLSQKYQQNLFENRKLLSDLKEALEKNLQPETGLALNAKEKYQIKRRIKTVSESAEKIQKNFTNREKKIISKIEKFANAPSDRFTFVYESLKRNE